MNDLVLVRQNEKFECGLAVLVMIGNYYGHKITLAWLRHKYKNYGTRISFNNLMDIAKEMGLNSRAYKVDVDSIKNLKLPAVLHWKEEHFVLAHTWDSDALKVFDPAVGEYFMTLDELSNKFSGHAMEFEGGENFKPITSNSNGITSSFFLTILIEQKYKIALIMGLALVLHAALLAGPLFIQLAIDQSLERSSVSHLLLLTMLFGSILLFKHLGQAVQNILLIKYESTLALAASNTIFERLLHLPEVYYRRRSSGEIENVYSASITSRRRFVKHYLLLPIELISFVAIVGIMLFFSPLLAWLIVFMKIAEKFVEFRLSQKMTPLMDKAESQRKALQSSFSETVAQLKGAADYGTTEAQIKSWQKSHASLLDTNAKLFLKKVFSNTLRHLSSAVIYFLLLFVSFYYVLTEYWSLGVALAFVAYTELLFNRMERIGIALKKLKDFHADLEKLDDLNAYPLTNSNLSEPHKDVT